MRQRCFNKSGEELPLCLSFVENGKSGAAPVEKVENLKSAGTSGISKNPLLFYARE
jgi:hypothetical protein